ncbi:ATP-binding protein [Legionella waltersii]|uniref:histidine kinase n=1 Tax=Legionella waltersii TaxID=66969 RepID=A0A0W1ADA5_9GAMM|nr:ATP-binding protein [Legionella waltersii]KTD79303.1 sensory box sensor histidine kinase/response regulator [Legionella waltersii]SNV12975.1 sensory box sensor histidine kinase/response regulator [Legionella waltersii]
MPFNKLNELNKIIDEKDEEIKRLSQALEEEKIKLQQEIQSIHDYYDNIIALMPGHVYWLDKNNVFLGCNDLQAKDACLGSRKEIVGKTNFDMPWKDQAEELNRINKLVMETGTPNSVEEYAVMANGMSIYLSQKVPLYNKQNEIIGVLGLSMDITERKKMEVALRKAKENAEIANQAKTEFIANISHDFHTPLSGIVGMSKLLEEKALTPENKQYARWINESGEQLLELLKSVLEIVSADNIRENDTQFELFDLRKNIQDIANLMQPSLQIRNNQFEIQIDESMPEFVITDGVKLRKALLNLLDNAIQYTERGIITLKIDVLGIENNYVQLKFNIIDTGTGVPIELQPKIFDHYARPSTEKGKHGGYGVGLHIAQKYVGLLGGEIDLISEVGKGSTFFFTLNMKIKTEDDYAVDLSKWEKGALSKQPLILLVEDNIIELRLIESVIEKAGYPYYSAIDGEHALELIESNDFDLIITDTNLQGIINKNLALCIRDWEKLKGKSPIPIIGLTLNDPSEVENDYMLWGINRVLHKPVDLKTIQSAVNELLKHGD